MLQFKAIILSTEDGSGAYIETPVGTDIETLFGSKRPKVKALFDNKIEYRGTLTRMKTEQHILIVLKEIRQQLCKKAGEEISVKIELDTAARTVKIPAVLQTALDKDTEIAAFFNNLSYTCRREYVQHIMEAKKEETRLRRTEKTIETLRQQLQQK